jgi:threonine dehydratase
LQDVRSFKIRGAYNAISQLSDEEKKRGVVCASAGNHAQGVAFSCNQLKIKGKIFMPTITPNQKVEKVKKFGGKYSEVVLIGSTFDEASKHSREYQRQHGAVFIHPFDAEATIAGQGTIGKEIYEQLKGEVDFVLVAIGGGGMSSGIATYLKNISPKTQVIGLEPKGAPGMKKSLANKQVTSLEKIDTFADGIAVQTVGQITFQHCQKYLDEIITIPEGEIATNMVELYQSEGIITEPAGAIAVAGLRHLKEKIKGKKAVAIISGGNNDLLRYPEILERSLIWQGKKHYFIINFAQKPGQLKTLLDKVLGPSDDIVRFEYIKKTNKETGAALVGIELAAKKDYKPLVHNLDQYEFDYRILKPEDLLYQYLI